MRNITRVLGVVAATAAMALTVGCSSGSDDDNTSGSNGGDNPASVEKVKYLTGAAILGREAFIYVAIEKGYFKEVGLEVEVQAGKGTAPNLALLQSGQVDYAALDITASLIEYGKEGSKFKDFTIFNAIQQRNLQCIMALEGSGINSPKDLAGKKISYLPGGVAYSLFPAYAKLAGIDASKIQWVNLPLEQHPQALAAGTVNAATQFAVGKPGIEKAAQGKKAVVMPYTDYLTDLYGVGVGVSKKTATEKADQVRRFNAAMLKGLRDAMDNPAEAGKIYAKYQKTQPEPVAAAENTLMVPYVKSSGGGAAVGALEAERVARNIAIIQGAGLIKTSFQPDAVVSFDFAPKS